MSPPSAATRPRWLDGNQFELLENGEQFFPAVFAAIDQARRELLIETFILFEDEVGRALHRHLLEAARRGVSIDLTIDDYGSPDLSDEFQQALVSAGVRIHVYDPRPRVFGLRTNIFRRLHRKLVVIDGETAFVGGINYAVDQLAESGPEGKQDYAVQITGPLVQEIQRFAHAQASLFGPARSSWWQRNRMERRRKRAAAPRGSSPGQALFVTRDNRHHRDDIERHYRIAIRAARREIIICNAYFFPGYRLLRQLRHATRRGVSVKLILQGEPDMPVVQTWTTMLYPLMLRAGIEIHEYCRRPMHGKVAVIDNDWSTVGSSNLDPLSLALNLEANVVIRDPQFVTHLRQRLTTMIHESCRRVDPMSAGQQSRLIIMLHTLAYHCTRHFPSWAGWLPSHQPRLQSIDPQSGNVALNDVANTRSAG